MDVLVMDIVEAIKARRDVSKFKPEPVPEQVVQLIFNAVRLAPSVNNMQPWRFVLVTDEELKVKVAAAANHQKWIAEAPIVVVALALLDQSDSLIGGYMSSYPVDVAFAIDHLLLVAASQGLGTCYVSYFDEEKVRELLSAPSDAKVVGIIPMGYPAEVPDPPGSKNFSEILSYNRFQ
jgi:nitroreductase